MLTLREYFNQYKGFDFSVKGGWGRSKEDACIIDADDSTVEKGIPFDGIGMEYQLVREITYFELLSSRQYRRQKGLGRMSEQVSAIGEVFPVGRRCVRADFHLSVTGDEPYRFA